MTTFFISDLHLGHEFAAKTRGFALVDEHDWQIVENINKIVNKQDKLYILGDLAFTDKGMKWADQIRCKNIELILGNHDKYPVQQYLRHVQKIHGFRTYHNYWISHAPIHPYELRQRMNIHGHVHKFSDTQKIEDPRYYNVNVEYHNLGPVAFTEIDRVVTERTKGV